MWASYGVLLYIPWLATQRESGTDRDVSAYGAWALSTVESCTVLQCYSKALDVAHLRRNCHRGGFRCLCARTRENSCLRSKPAISHICQWRCASDWRSPPAYIPARAATGVGPLWPCCVHVIGSHMSGRVFESDFTLVFVFVPSPRIALPPKCSRSLWTG